MAVSQETLRLIVDAQLKGQKSLDDVIKGLDGISRASKQANSSLKVISLDVLFSRGKQLATAALDIGLLGTRIDSLRESFATTAASVGQDADSMLAALEASSRGQINSIDLITSANRAMLLGVASSAEDMAKLMEIAEVRGSAMGLTLNQAFNDIVTGIGRGSALILDNLGIVVDLEKAYRSFAEQNGRTVGSLTDIEKKQLIVNEVIAQSQDLVEGADFSKLTSEFEKAQAQAENFGINLANAFTEIIGRDLAGRLADQLEDLNDILNSDFGSQSIGFLAEFVDIQLSTIDDRIDQSIARGEALIQTYETLFGSNVFGDFFGNAQQEVLDFIDTLDLAQVAAAQIVIGELNLPAGIDTGLTSVLNSLVAIKNTRADVEIQAAVDASAAFDQAKIRAFESGVEATADAVRQANLEFEELLKTIDRLESSGARAIGSAAAGIADIVGQETALRLAQDVTDEYKNQINAIDFANTSLAERAFLETKIRNDALEGFNVIQEQFNQSQQAARNVASSGEQAFNQLKGKVSSVLSEALDVGVGIDFDEILGRQDAINEPARRLADIAVNGFNSPWVDYFKQEFPELAKSLFAEGFDVKEQAARLLQGFEQGLRPELIDKNLAKERIRALIVGEANLAQLAEEITQELAAEFAGTDFGNIANLTNKVLGIDTGKVQSQGQDLSEVFKQGVETGLQQVNSQGGQFEKLLVGETDFTTLATNLLQRFTTAFNNVAPEQSTSLIQQMLNISGSPEVGIQANALAEGFTFAFANTGIGLQISTVIETQMNDEKNLTVLRQSGANSGANWGTGFLNSVESGVPPRLISILVDLVTPGVQAGLTRQESLTEPQ